MKSGRGNQLRSYLGRFVWAVWLTALLVLPLIAGFAQQPQEPPVEDDTVVRLQSELVSFTVVVSTTDGRPLPALKAEHFRVFEDHKRQEIVYFAAVDAPVDMLLLIDDSNSMQEKMPLVKQAAEVFFDRLRPQDRAGLVAFGEQTVLLADLVRSPTKLKQALARIPAEAGTNFYDALYLSAQELVRQASGERKAIIVLSDGVDTSSYYSFEQASQLLERSGITAYFIEVDTLDDMIQGLKGERKGRPRLTLSAAQLEKYRRAYRPEEPAAFYRDARFFSVEERVQIARALYQLARQELRHLAERTGGRVFPLKDFSQLSAIYHQISAELSTLYSIGYHPTNTKRDGAWRSLRVELSVPNAKAHARSGYWAPAK